MIWLVGALCFIALNFFLYTLVLRHVRAFGSERLIFLYQVLSFLALPIVLLALGPAVTDVSASLVAATSLHAIYSLSFLELWSLSEGSYSLRMVDRVERLGVMPEDTDTSDLEKIGASKKSARLQSLVGLGIAKRDGERYLLTSRGRIAAIPLRFLVWLVNIRDRIG
jgi:hypothetical protein